MLTQLSITNFGLIDKLSVDFYHQLNVLTGETGAGKSIVIGALRSALGEKMDVSQLRLADHPCVIEAVFDLSNTELLQVELLKEFLEQDDSSLIIHRTLSPEGRNKIKINGQTVTLGQLRTLGNYLMDFHGPHDHQMLLSKESHNHLLDQLCEFKTNLDDYKKIYKEYAQIQKKILELSNLTQSRDRELDLLTHQVKELEQVPLNEEYFAEVEHNKVKVDNAQKLNESVSAILNLLEDGDTSSSELIRQCFTDMKQLNRLDENTGKFYDELNVLQETHDLLASNLRDYAGGLRFDASEAEHIYAQSDLYDDILRKYGPGIEDAKDFYEKAKVKYDLLSDLEGNDAQLQKQLGNVGKKLKVLADELTAERKRQAKFLKKTIEKELQELGIAHVQFVVQFVKKDFDEKGQEDAEFYISPNVGEDLKPMAEIVSSGEAARVMLALKKALIAVDPIPVLVFDEIDAQIGGRLGTITGEKLRDISRKRQVILITHLPQIASFADLHLKVIKSVKEGRSITQLIPLEKDERVFELSQMMSGQKQSDVSLKHARDMLSAAGK